MRRVVVTGIGIWSCIGLNQEEVSQNLRTGYCGIGIDQKRLAYGFRSPLTGIVPHPELKPLLNRRLRVSLSEEAEYAYMAAKEALNQAKIDDDYLLNNEVGVIFGNDSSAKAVVESHELMLEKKDSSLLGSGLIFQSMNSTVNMNLSSIFHLRGINFSVSSACASGSHAIGLGKLFIEQGMQDMVLVGGAQEINPYALAAFDALGTFSQRISAPKEASRPFDRNRDGLIPSGGAAALVLEEYEHAEKRGASILAEIAGYGFSSNGIGISQPSADGCLTAMERAIQNAGVSVNDINYVNAHATSTLQGDKEEALALQRLFGSSRAWISSTKGMTGHECWMSGASETVYSILMMKNHFIAPNINLQDWDETIIGLNMATQTQDADISCCLNNSFGFGGTNSALIIKNINQ